MLKIFLFIVILVTALYCLYLALTKKDDENEDDPSVVIIEWVLSIGAMVWLLTFVLELKDVFITLRGDVSQTVKMVDQ